MTDPYSEWDAAYVLGSLSSSERREFELHLRQCADCSNAVAELAGMPGLLAIVPASEALRDDDGIDAQELPATVLPRLARAIKRHRVRRRVTITSSLVAATAAAVTALALFLSPIVSSQLVPTSVVTLSAVQPSELSADVTLVDQSWGTRLDTHCTYQTGDRSAGAEAYSLWVTSTDGRQSEVASWQSAPGSTVTPTATTSLAKEQIASVEIRDVSTGQVVLRGTL